MRKNKYATPLEGQPRHRWAFVFIGVALLAMGGASLLSGKLVYQNYWSAPVFAPYAILLGIIALIAAFRFRIKKGRR